ncbi:hypothetical protein WJX79_010540 [Trebouxia sp. C0005]
MAAVAVSSASGLLSLLDEDDESLKLYALQSLNRIVHEFWFQIASQQAIASVEAFYEDETFTHRDLAALVASKVFYHLGELDQALTYALGAGSLFDITEPTEYVQTILSRCVDLYLEQRNSAATGTKVDIDSRLAAIVERMFERCFRDGQYEQAVGIALEARRLDKLEQTIKSSPDMVRILTYSLQVCQTLVISREFRQKVLRLLIKLYESVPNPDWVNICQCLMFLDDSQEVAKILHTLIEGTEEEALLAYQVCFDLFENEMQSFLLKVGEHLDTLSPQPPPAQEPAAATDTTEQAAGADNMDTDSDLQILRIMKGAVEARNSVCHSAVIFANATMHSGTTVDAFLRENLDWLSRATNWAKFNATAGLGVIHRGHLSQGQALMAPYLPRNGASGSPYSEGGALYALGLIHANHGQDIRDFLLESLRGTQNEVTQHGACLGLGLAGLGSGDDEVFEDLKNVLYLDSAVAGEAAGLALGLLHVGTATEKATEMLAYAHDTQHEKIIRGIAMGLALIMYGREEEAETLIEQMSRDQDPILRYGGMFVIGMAYRGTANNAAIQKLLHFAVSDVSDDVRRAAVLCLGFVLLGVPEQCPRIVSLLSQSYNPHVRYGAAMAVGICCSGTGMQDAVDLLHPLLTDTVDYVKQGALIATALVLMQQPESKVSDFRKLVDGKIGDKHEEVMSRMGAIMAAGILDAGGRNVTVGLRSHSGYFRRTSIVALAIFSQYWYWYPLSYFLTLTLQPTALLGLNSDLQMPKLQVTSDCSPSMFAYPPPVTTETKDTGAKVPKAVLSTTAKAKDKAKKKDAEKALKEGRSTADQDKDASVKPEGMQLDETDKAQAKPAEAAGAKDGAQDGGKEGSTEGAKEGQKEAAAPKEPEPSSHSLDNPARVVPAQEKLVKFPEGSRYTPIRPGRTAGILLLKDSTPGEEAELVSQGNPPAGAQAAQTNPPSAAAPQAGQQAEEEEPPPPEPFEFAPGGM